MKMSFHHLINAVSNLDETEESDETTAPSQMDLFLIQNQAISCGRAEFVFPSDEKEKLDDFETKVSKCVDTVKAEWKKLLKSYCQNIHKSIRNANLATKYRQWLQRNPPFIPKCFRPRPTNPVNAEVDAILLEQAKANVENSTLPPL